MVSGHNKGADGAVVAQAGREGIKTGLRQPSSALRDAKAARHGCGHAFDVTRERCIVLQVIRRMIAHHVENRRSGALRVVQVGHAIGKARAEVQQVERGLVGHAAIAIGGTRDHALKETQHRADMGLFIERSDELHLGGAWIGKAGVDAVFRQGINQ